MNKLVRIKDTPYIGVYYDMFSGTLEEVSSNVLGIRDKLKELIDTINSGKQKGYGPVTDISEYKTIELECYSGYDGLEISVIGYRDMTQEEILAELEAEKKRLELAEKRRLSAKQSADTRKKMKEEEERALFERLKAKYE